MKLFLQVIIGLDSTWLASQSTCGICNDGDESVLHVLRDCEVAKNIWISIGASRIHAEFFYQSSPFLAGRELHGLDPFSSRG